VRFEEARDIVSVVVAFAGAAPRTVGLSYLQKHWPERRVEALADLTNPCASGWSGMDDWFNVAWRKAAVARRALDRRTLEITFRPLSAEFGRKVKGYDVAFRRTLGVRVDSPVSARIRSIAVHTVSKPVTSRIRVRLNAGRRTPGDTVGLDTYNARIRKVTPVGGALLHDGALVRSGSSRQEFELALEHMVPAHRHCGDDGHVRFVLGSDSFTISLESLRAQGPVWAADWGVFITDASDSTTFGQYRGRWKDAKTVSAMVKQLPEQSYGAAYLGQPRPHAVAYSLGIKYSRQRFWLEPNGDLCLARHGMDINGPDRKRYANKGEGRFFFGLEDWSTVSRCPAPAPAVEYAIRLRKGALEVEQRSVATPLEGPLTDESFRGDRTTVCLLKFRFTNTGTEPVEARLPVAYSQESHRTSNVYPIFRKRRQGAHPWMVPSSPREKLSVSSGRVYGSWKGGRVLRCAVDTSMRVEALQGSVVLHRTLGPGQNCEAVLKVPYIALDRPGELRALDALAFGPVCRRMAAFWRAENAKGAQLRTPITQLNDLHRTHLSYIQLSDTAMPGEPYLVNTSVGTSTYGNFSNESCMICQELEQRGFIEDSRRRLALWVKYQGAARQPGNFTDYEGMYYGAAGYERGNYNQHHGWVLWKIADHFLFTGDRRWFGGVADSVLAGCDWISRQRRATTERLPHSRGWEKGFLPAGSLEDVTDFYYWLSTNALTWRGLDTAARALEAYGYPAAARVRADADAYRRDLRAGFETMRRHSPLIRLRDGRWIPHYPSRLYCRGRDFGWIREVLEGSVYLLIAGLYGARSREASWILDDFQDTRLMNPPYGYPIVNPGDEWYDRGGVSIQPNLLATLMPYLDRDEPEMYIWIFHNCWAACYREEINAMIEHPWPFLGYSNTAHPKTSDEANAVMWLRYMLVYPFGNTLHIGRAMPRAWLAAGPVSLERVLTRFGTVSVAYEPSPGARTVRATVTFGQRQAPGRFLIRFRHPERRLRSVTVNGKPHRAFDPVRGDVDVTGRAGRVVVEARFAG